MTLHIHIHVYTCVYIYTYIAIATSADLAVLSVQNLNICQCARDVLCAWTDEQLKGFVHCAPSIADIEIKKPAYVSNAIHFVSTMKSGLQTGCLPTKTLLEIWIAQMFLVGWYTMNA